ncbi:hypothetical protein BDQ17DRAFT_1252430 [Cyathus striatus]|nr:hypothetical protein BDQ17DRAFT_1252430 [Cyathus striatus]
MTADLLYYRTVLTRIKSQRSLVKGGQNRKPSMVALQGLISYSLGSGIDGKTLNELTCCNTSLRGGGTGGVCTNEGVLACSKCGLAKYCSGRCQRQHWTKHKLDCEHAYFDDNWKPSWVIEGRKPSFFLPAATVTPTPTSAPVSMTSHTRLWGDVPAYDILQLNHNEGLNSERSDFKVCFTEATDIRNLIETVNNLPKDYRGKCDILLNHPDATVVNRNLVILSVLLGPGPTIEESAELAVHLMYSASLTGAGESYVRRCVQRIYGEGSSDSGDMTFHCTLRTRGRGKLASVQPMMAVKKPREMFLSTFGLDKAIKSFHGTLLDPAREDDRDLLLDGLKPPHRLALSHFWHTGVLLPFSARTSSFTQPNRLQFTSQGTWLGTPADISPLPGWNLTLLAPTIRRYSLDANDTFGALFFHIRDSLIQFATRLRDFAVDVHLTSYDPRILSKGMYFLPAPFHGACFDRIDLGDVGDRVSMRGCIEDWGRLLAKKNVNAGIVMHSRRWHVGSPGATARYNPDIVDVLRRRCLGRPVLEEQLGKLLSRGQYSPRVYRLVESMDAFVDHKEAFGKYVEAQDVVSVAGELGLRIREVNKIHPKRFGVPLNSTQSLPDLSKEEFYDLFTLGGLDLTIRFIEFEAAPEGVDWTEDEEGGIDAVRDYAALVVLVD